MLQKEEQRKVDELLLLEVQNHKNIFDVKNSEFKDAVKWHKSMQVFECRTKHNTQKCKTPKLEPLLLLKISIKTLGEYILQIILVEYWSSSRWWSYSTIHQILDDF